MIQINELTKRYDNGVLALDHVTYKIEPGEIFCLLGANGAGKTTTISMLCGLLEPDSGAVRIVGSKLDKDAALKAHIGLVPQEIALYEDISARENLAFWGKMYGLSGRQLTERVDEVLELIELEERQKDRVEKYSGGMKRRVNIGVALLHRPQVLFLDEPTVGIDPQSRRKILDSVKALKEQGMTVLYTTHYMEEAEELSDRVGIIDHGSLIAVGTQAELTKVVGQQETLRLHLGEGFIGEEFHDHFGNLSDPFKA